MTKNRIRSVLSGVLLVLSVVLSILGCYCWYAALSGLEVVDRLAVAWPVEPSACSLELAPLRERVKLALEIHQLWADGEIANPEVVGDLEWHEEWIDTYSELLLLLDTLEEDCK